MPFGHRHQHLAEAAFALVFAAIVRRLPTRTARWVGELLGSALRRLLAKRRRIAEGNLRRGFPTLEPTERERILRGHFRHLGVSLVELLRFPTTWRGLVESVNVIGREHLDAAQATGKGVLVFVAHTGNWEILAPLWPRLHPSPMVLMHPLPNPVLNRMVTRCRQVSGLELVARQGGLKRLVSGLKSGRTVGLLADQDAGANGVFVPFFGELASCEPSPVALSRRLDCPLLLCLAFRNEDGTHRVLFEPIPKDGDDAARLAFIYQRLETHVRENPSQWLWIHNRWKTRPAVSASSR